MVQPGYLSNNRLIFYRVESAGRVHQTSANFQHLTGMQGDAQLQGVKAIAIARGPAPPDVRSLANGAITTTWYITQDAVKQYRLLHQARFLSVVMLWHLTKSLPWCLAVTDVAGHTDSPQCSDIAACTYFRHCLHINWLATA